MDPVTSTPLSFEQAIGFSQDLLTRWQAQQLVAAEAQAALAQLLSSTQGARGFFVALLTGDSQLADQPPPELLAALQAAPDSATELLVKNLAMSTAMAITHQRNGDQTQVQGSQRVARRTAHLLQQLCSPTLASLLQAMLASAQSQTGPYADFLKRWGYDAEQHQAIADAIAAVEPLS